MEIKIRKFLPGDLERVMEIERISFPKPYPKSYFEELYQHYPEEFFVAESRKKIIGYTIGRFKNRVPAKRVGEIVSLAVDPNWRRKGIGRELTHFLITHFKEKGVKEIFLHVRTGNKGGIEFYKNFNFKIIKTIEKYYSDGDDAYLMRKEI